MQELRRLLDAGTISQTIFDRMRESLGVSQGPMDEVLASLKETQAELDKTAQKKAALDQIMAGGGQGFSTEAFDKVTESLTGANDQLTIMGVAVGDTLAQGVSGLVDSFGDANQSFQSFAASFLKSIGAMIAKALILKAINSAFGSNLGGLGGFSASAKGNAFSSMTLPQGVYTRPTFFNYGHQIQPFAMGGVFSRTGVLGEAGPEAVAPLRRNRQGQLGVMASPVVVNVNNTNADNKVEVKEATREDGSKVIDIMIKKKVMEALGDGSADRLFQRRWGLSPKPM
jgi:lambda family phage tail tape measure protein